MPAGFGDGMDNDTTYGAGAGLSLVGTTFSADTIHLQRRVGGTCGPGNAIRVVNEDGSVNCEADDDTTYSAGSGLELLDTTFKVDTSAIQQRVNGACGGGNSWLAILSRLVRRRRRRNQSFERKSVTSCWTPPHWLGSGTNACPPSRRGFRSNEYSVRQQ